MADFDSCALGGDPCCLVTHFRNARRFGPCKAPNLKNEVGFQRAERVGSKDKRLLKCVHARMDCCYEYKQFGAEEVPIVR
jgi:hypothetical protein